MDVKLPDGTILQNVPEGTTKADLVAKLKANGYDVSKLSPQEEGMMDRVGKIGMAGLKGMVSGGPVSALASVGGESMRQYGAVMDKLAYDAGGKVTDLTGSPEAGFAANVATQALPTIVSGVVSSKVAEPVMKPLARKLMNSALKPPVGQPAKGARAVETMLKEGALPTKASAEAMFAKVDKLDDDLTKIIFNSGKTVDRGKISGPLQDYINELQKVPGANVTAAEKVLDDFLTMYSGKQQIPVQEVQEMKRGIYKYLKENAYGAVKAPGTEAQKALARGAKEEIALAEPKVAGINAQMSDLTNAGKMADKRAAVEANKNPLGLGALITQPWMIPVWMWDRSSAAKAYLANHLYSGSAAGGAGAVGMAARNGLYSKRDE